MFDLFISKAYAMAPAGGEGAPQGGFVELLFPMLLMFGVIYLLIIRPQKKQAQQHKEFIAALKKGDEVVTSGGIFGKVAGVADNTVTVEIANGVKIKVIKGHISRSQQNEQTAQQNKNATVKAVKAK